MKTLFVALTLVSLAGCYVTPDEWEWVETVCENNGGVEHLDMADKHAHCMNGARFKK